MAMASVGTAAGDGSVAIPQEDLLSLGNRITTAADNHGQPSLVNLPNDVLERLFKMLPVPDRGRLACTCSRLSDVVHWPSVWRDITIRLSTIRARHCCYSIISEMDRAVIRKYSKFFRHVEIIIPSDLVTYESFGLLSELRYRRLVKKVVWTADTCFALSHPQIWFDRYIFFDGLHSTLPVLANLLEPSTQISLKLNSLDADVMHMNAATVLEKCSRLTWIILLTTPDSFSQYPNVVLPVGSPLSVAVVSICAALQVIEMNIVNLSDELLQELSDTSGRRCQLKRLIVGDSDKIKFCYPQLSSAAWSRLTAANPLVQVECSVRADGFAQVSSAIKPETPLVKLAALLNTEVDTGSILALCELCKQQSSTLQYFALSGASSLRSQKAIEGLRSMLLACPSLYLYCNADVDDQIIKDLSTDSRHWRRFHFTDSDHT